MSAKKAITYVGLWVSLALLFNVGIYFFWNTFFGGTQEHAVKAAVDFLGGYIIELSLSIDNLFVFILIFTSFKIEGKNQLRVLNWGIIGAIILRLIFILLGVSVVRLFENVLVIFGLILIYSGVQMAFEKGNSKDFTDSKMLKLTSKIIPLTDKFHGDKFFTRIDGKLFATPLFAVLIVIDVMDVVFAVDSIPAIFSITTDAFIVFTSNLFAIIGLRSMYFVLLKLHEEFEYVRYGVALILVFTGLKLGLTFFTIKIDTVLSLIIIFTILFSSIFVSFAVSRHKKRKHSRKVGKVK